MQPRPRSVPAISNRVFNIPRISNIKYEEGPTYQVFYHSPVSLLSPKKVKKSLSAEATCSLVPRSVRAMRIGFFFSLSWPSWATTATTTRTSKSNSLRLAKQQFCTCITLFCTFLCRHWTGKCLISRFYGGRKQAMATFSFSFWT